MIGVTQALVISIVLTLVKSQGASWHDPNQLHPVHGLYVKPSADGTTGDLYVAATEDNGVKSQWLTDQPINFLPVGAATQQHQAAVSAPNTPSYSASTHDENQSTQKRSVITTPSVQYAYALPVTPTDGGALPYPYTIPTTLSTTQSTSAVSETTQPQCADTATAIPYNPFQFFYPHIMAAYANAKSILKDSGMSDDKAGTIVSQASPMWSPYGAYPMYVMVDPSAWAQAQTTTQTTTANASSEK